MRVVRAEGDFPSAAADVLARVLRAGLDASSRVSFAVSGGSTPAVVFRVLSEASIDWERIDLFQVDERIAPRGDAARNLVGLESSLTSVVPVTLHPMPVEASDLDAAAAGYAATLPRTFDVVHLGLGADGHTASLVPGDPALAVTDRDVVVTESYQGHRRMTFTYPVLNRAVSRVWLVSGADKQAAVQRLLASDQTIPAGRVRQENATLVVDTAALP